MPCLKKDGYKVCPTISNLKNNKVPEVFHKNNPYTIENIKRYLKINNLNIELLSNEYVSNSTGLHCKCKIDGYEWYPCWGSLNSGHGCPKCELNNRKGSIKEEDYDKVVDIYLNTNISIINIAKMFGAKSKDSVYRVLRKMNIEIINDRASFHVFIDQTIKSDIIKMYEKEKISMRQISLKLNVPVYTIREILKKENINIREHYANEFDENYFDVIDSSNKAYLLGFLYADGCVNKNNCISIIVNQKDREILEMFKNELKATNPITEINRKNGKIHVRIVFCSKHMSDTLIQIGCVHNKTKQLHFPNIDEKYKWHFIRGFMDGDGSIVIRKKVNLKGEIRKYALLGFVGTESMMNSLKNIFNVDYNIRFHRNAYHLQFGKESEVLRICELIYKDAELYMTRKYNNYIEYLEYIKMRNKGVILHEE